MATDARRAREIGEPESDPGRVFLVDDDASVRRALVRLLRAQGLSVSSFATAEDFLSQVPADVTSACLVVDLLMPGLGGLDLQELMRERGFDMPIVFISGRGDLASGVRAMKSGAVDFLEKPVSAPELWPPCEAPSTDHRRDAGATRRISEVLRGRYSTPHAARARGLRPDRDRRCSTSRWAPSWAPPRRRSRSIAPG